MTAGRTNSDTLSKDWGTPRKYVDAVRAAFSGAISLDPCSNHWSIVQAQTEWRLPRDDGLQKIWDYPTIFVNPPYGGDAERGTRISHWLTKCADANEEFGAEVIALVPVAANTRHWKESIWARASAVCFLYDTRLRFLENGLDVGKGAPMACATVYWGHKIQQFSAEFAKHGAVVDLKSVKLPNERKLQSQVSMLPFRKIG